MIQPDGFSRQAVLNTGSQVSPHKFFYVTPKKLQKRKSFSVYKERIKNNSH